MAREAAWLLCVGAAHAAVERVVLLHSTVARVGLAPVGKPDGASLAVDAAQRNLLSPREAVEVVAGA
eukprot:1965083-Prymnesium_polylepis.1